MESTFPKLLKDSNCLHLICVKLTRCFLALHFLGGVKSYTTGDKVFFSMKTNAKNTGHILLELPWYHL